MTETVYSTTNTVRLTVHAEDGKKSAQKISNLSKIQIKERAKALADAGREWMVDARDGVEKYQRRAVDRRGDGLSRALGFHQGGDQYEYSKQGADAVADRIPQLLAECVFWE